RRPAAASARGQRAPATRGGAAAPAADAPPPRGEGGAGPIRGRAGRRRAVSGAGRQGAVSAGRRERMPVARRAVSGAGCQRAVSGAAAPTGLPSAVTRETSYTPSILRTCPRTDCRCEGPARSEEQELGARRAVWAWAEADCSVTGCCAVTLA